MNKLVALLIFVSFSTHAQVSLVNAKNKIDGDYFYVLPKTGIALHGTIKKTSYKADKDFFIYFDSVLQWSPDKKYNATKEEKAEKDKQTRRLLKDFDIDVDVYLKLNSMMRLGENIYSAYEFGEIKMAPVALADPSKTFKILGSKRFLKNTSVNFVYDKDGMLSSGESKSENKAFDVAIKGLSGIATIIGSAFRGKSNTLKLHPEVEKLANLYQKRDERLLENIHYSGEVYTERKDLMDAAILRQSGEIFYRVKEVATPFRVTYVPLPGDTVKRKDKTVILFDLDDIKGTLNINKKELPNIDFMTTAKTDETKDLSKGHSITIIQKLTSGAASSNRSFSESFTPRNPDKESGFAFNIPHTSIVKYNNPEDVLKDIQVIKICQFGIVSYINKKQSKVSFELNPLTGELLKVSGERNAVNGDNIAGAATATDAFIRSLQKDDEATRLEAELKTLDLKKKIKDLKEAEKKSD